MTNTHHHHSSSTIIQDHHLLLQVDTPISSLHTSPLPRGPTKKRARFADEPPPNDHRPSDQHHPQPAALLSSFVTFHSDDPPLKKLKLQPPSNPFHSFDLSTNQTLRQAMYLTFINTAFSERERGELERYEQLLAQFDPFLSSQRSSSSSQELDPPNVPLARIQGWLSALTSIASQLGRHHSTLVEKVLGLPWTVFEDEFVSTFTTFVNGLVSARSEWIQTVLESVIRGFRYRSISSEYRSTLLPSAVNRRLIYSRLHSLLRSILRLIPTLPSTLWPILDSHFPKKREHRDGHVCYLSNLLEISSYCPELNDKILQLSIDKCLKIDVEIQVEVDDWEDHEGRLEEEIFGRSVEDPFDKSWTDDQPSDSDLDGDQEDINFDELSSDDGGDLSSDQAHRSKLPSAQSITHVKKLAAKLDGMLRCMFDHLQLTCVGTAIESTCSDPNEVREQDSFQSNQSSSQPTLDPKRQFDREVLFDLLLSNFESSILRTRRTRYVQFILFWYASLDASFADSLLATLVELALYKAEDNSVPIVTSVAAVSYIASLISRAKYIDQRVTRHVISLLCARLDLGLSDPSTISSVNSQVIWYAIAQAIFYIFCFRWKDLLLEDDDDDHDGTDDQYHQLTIRFSRPHKFNERWLGDLRVLERAIISSLNPLKFCAATVVGQFAKISHQTNLIYCYDIMRRNDNSNKNRPRSSKDPKEKSTPRSTLSLALPSPALVTSQTSSESSSPSESSPGPPLMINSRSSAHDSPLLPPINLSMPVSSATTARNEQIIKSVLMESKIDSFFPFDPFKLPLTSIYLDSIYRVWEGHDAEEDDEEDDD